MQQSLLLYYVVSGQRVKVNAYFAELLLAAIITIIYTL